MIKQQRDRCERSYADATDPRTPLVPSKPTMRKASEFRDHAIECRQLAAAMDGEQRRQLLEMAAAWEQLADERAELVGRYPDLAIDGEVQDGLSTARGAPASR
jgi:hypothetical protein